MMRTFYGDSGQTRKETRKRRTRALINEYFGLGLGLPCPNPNPNPRSVHDYIRTAVYLPPVHSPLLSTTMDGATSATVSISVASRMQLRIKLNTYL